jgi:pimeloyl-ACP methyl ester carboxylesterase
MSPFYFGTAERRLFGIYEAARRSPVKGAAVLCYPWGPEYIHAHRSLRQLSNMLTAAGIHTLRFDYFGTGDSAGEMTEAQLADWEANIRTALSELQDITNATQVSLIGLRLGATLAANIAVTAGPRLRSLVLWDPIVCGEEHVNDLYRASPAGAETREQKLARSTDIGGGYEVLGFPLTDQMAREIGTLDLIALAPALPTRSLIVLSHPLPSHAALQRALDQSSGQHAIERIACHPPWIELPLGHPLAGTAPVRVLQRIVEWLT